MRKIFLSALVAILIIFNSFSAFAASIKNDKLKDFLYLCATSTYDEISLVINEQDKDATDNNGRTALMYAVHYNPEPKIVKMLIDYGYSVNAVDYYGETVLMHAMYLNNLDTIKILLENGAEVNASSEEGAYRTALMVASQYSNKLPLFHLLLNHGARIDAEDIFGNTAFFYACRYNDNFQVVQFLLEQGADINQSNRSKITPLMLATLNATNGLPIVTLLLKEGANVHAYDETLNTALIYAALYNDETQLYELLLSYGADKDFANIAGYTAADYAKFNERSEEIQNLLK